MISQSQNRVKAIKSKFENLGTESPGITEKKTLSNNSSQLYKFKPELTRDVAENSNNKENTVNRNDSKTFDSPIRNTSQLYKYGARTDTKKSVSDSKKTLSRQSSDPGSKKLHRSHAFRCDRSQKIVSPKRHGSCYGRSESGDFTLKTEKKLSKDRLKRLGNLLEDQMRKENFVVSLEKVVQTDFVVGCNNLVDRDNFVSPMENFDIDIQSENCEPLQTDNIENILNGSIEKTEEMDFNSEFPIVNDDLIIKEDFILNNSVPDSEVPQHILDQYAKVIKPKKKEPTDGMTDSGVSSETENLEEERTGRIKKLMSQFEKTDNNLETMNDLCASSETMRLERKNPHLVLTDTLKKALKQPLPTGPPPKKPPRTFTAMAEISESPEKQKKDAKKMLEKLELVLQKREAKKPQTSTELESKTQTVPKKPKEIHYLCTEILDITQRTLLPNQLANNCFKSLNCAITNHSTLSLPYTQFNTNTNNLNSIKNNCCSCSNNSLNEKRLSTFMTDYRCEKCKVNDTKNFKCHLNCDCKTGNCRFFVDNEHIYDEPCVDGNGRRNSEVLRRSVYGTLNHSKSMEDIPSTSINEDQKIYDVPCEISRPATPEDDSSLTEETPEEKPTSNFEKLLSSFESASISSLGRKSSKDSDRSDSCEKESDSSVNKVSNVHRISLSSLGRKSSKDTDRNDSYDKESDCSVKVSNVHKFSNVYDISNVNVKRRSSSNLDREDKITSKLDLILKDSEKRFGMTDINDLKNRVRDETTETEKRKPEKPPMKPKPVLNRLSRSIDNIAEEKRDERRFATEAKRYQKRRDVRLSLPKKDNSQLDVDRENLNRLMNEIYETVTQACNMENKPGSFPTEQTDGASEESVKLTRSLTEKRKNYVRRVSSKVAYLDQKTKNTRYRHQTSICSYKSEIIDNPYSTFRSWKSFRASQNNLSKDTKMADVKVTDVKSDIDSFDSSVEDESVHEKTGCMDLDLPFERQNGLFDVCLVVGLNYMTGKAYVRSVFPEQVHLPPHIEQLVFPETLSSGSASGSGSGSGSWLADAGAALTYSLVLTDEQGERKYGYCRRVLPEGATVCLPLCYCLISKFRAPGFYYKVLQEIESHHGSSETEIQSILQQLYDSDFPRPGEEITISYISNMYISNDHISNNNISVRHSTNLEQLLKSKTLPDMRYRRQISSKSDRTNDTSNDSDKEHGNSKFEQRNSKFEQNNTKCEHNNSKCEHNNSKFEHNNSKCEQNNSKFENSNSKECDSDVTSNKSDNSDVHCSDVDNNNEPKKVVLTLDGVRIKSIKRPIEPRVLCSCMSSMLELCGSALALNMFASLLLERKMFLIGDRLGQISSCLEALQLSLYPFVWQQPLISSVPSEIQREVLDAPLPILAGCLTTQEALGSWGRGQEGMLIDLTHPSKVLICQGDESTILPTQSYKTLKTTLRMESRSKEDTAMKNVMISEAFLRFFVDILGDFFRYFSYGEMTDGALGKGGIVFDRDQFIKNTPSKQNQYFLEWFTETAMFNHFIQNMACEYHQRQKTLNSNSDNSNLNIKDFEYKQMDTPLPDFYDLFLDRLRSRTKVEVKIDSKSNYKNAVNKRVRLLKNKLRELVS